MFHSDIANLERDAQKCMEEIGASRFPLFVFTAKCTFLWPAQNSLAKFVGRFFIQLYLTTIPISSALQVFEECKGENINRNSIIECILQILLFSIILCIYTLMVLNQRKMTMCMSIIFRLFESSDLSGKEILDKTIKKAFWLGNIQMVAILILCASYVIFPVATPTILSWLISNNATYEKVLPLNTQLFLDENKYFNCIFVLQFFLVMLLVLVAEVINYYQCIYAGVIIGQLQCLEYYLNEIDNEFNRKIPEFRETKTNLICEKLKAIIRRHQNCIELFEMFHSMASPSAFGIIVVDTFVLVLTGTWMVISLANSDVTEAGKMFVVFTSVLIVIIELCIPSQLMSNASYAFFLRCYCINWYNYPVKARLMLIIIMAKSIKPLILAAGPTIELSFDTCSSVIKATISYVATFRSLYASL